MRWGAAGVALSLALLTGTAPAFGQSATTDADGNALRPAAPPSVAGGWMESTLTPTEYRIGVDDVLSIAVLQAPELSASVRVAAGGDISLPLIGTVHAAALTTRELEAVVEDRLRERFIRDPDVAVIATEIRSHGVSVVGAVRRPGLLQIRGATTLLEVLSLAGGLADNAGDSVVVVRAVEGKDSPQTIEIKLKALMAADVMANIHLLPGDVINVQNAALVYVMGAVNKPGAYAMRGNDRLTVLRALAFGEGVTATAAKRDAVVLRVGAQGERVEVPVDLDGIVKGTTPDIDLTAQDVLFVPVSGAKTMSRATMNFLTRVITLRGIIP